MQAFGANTVLVPMDQPHAISQHLPGILHHKYSVVIADMTYLVRGARKGYYYYINGVLHVAITNLIVCIAYMQDPNLIDDILSVSRLLSLSHEPLKVILLAVESEVVSKNLSGTALHLTGLRPHGKTGMPVRMYTSIPKPRLLH